MSFWFFTLGLIAAMGASSTSGCASVNPREPVAEVPLEPAVCIDGIGAQDWSLSGRMDRFGASAVGVAVVRNWGVDEVISVGSRSEGEQVAVEPSMMFQAASLSKPVTAVVVMALVDRGVLDLDLPVNDYMESWTLADRAGEPADGVTLRMLLSHSAGVNVRSYPGFERGAELPGVDEILAGAATAYSDPVRVEHAAGAYMYSGGGYMVVQRVIEDVTGRGLEDVADELVFEPTGMTRSTFDRYPEAEEVVFGHDWNGAVLRDRWQEYPQAAPAGLWSTPGDLARLIASLARAARGDTGEVVSVRSAKELLRPVVSGMGVGFGVHGAGSGVHLSHAGWTIGYRSYLIVFPLTGQGAVVMANSQSANRLVDEIVRGVAVREGWAGWSGGSRFELAEWSGERLDSLVGTYRMNPAGFSIRVSRLGAGVRIETPRGSWYTAYPVSVDRLVVAESGEFVDVVLGESGMRLGLWGMEAIRTDGPSD